MSMYGNSDKDYIAYEIEKFLEAGEYTLADLLQIITDVIKYRLS